MLPPSPASRHRRPGRHPQVDRVWRRSRWALRTPPRCTGYSDFRAMPVSRTFSRFDRAVEPSLVAPEVFPGSPRDYRRRRKSRKATPLGNIGARARPPVGARRGRGAARSTGTRRWTATVSRRGRAAWRASSSPGSTTAAWSARSALGSGERIVPGVPFPAPGRWIPERMARCALRRTVSAFLRSRRRSRERQACARLHGRASVRIAGGRSGAGFRTRMRAGRFRPAAGHGRHR